MSIINRLSISSKIMLPVALLLVFLVATTVFSLNGLYNAMLSERVLATQNIAESAATIAEHFVAKEESGEMTREEAQAAAKEAISAMRFDNGNYIFGFEPNGVNIIHANPNIIGRNMIDVTDKNDVPFVRLLLEAAQNGGGLVRLYFPKANSDIPLEKYNWGAPVRNWNWMVGTGVYVDDLDDEFWAQAQVKTVIGIGGTALALLFAFLVFRNIGPAIGRLTANMQSVANGNHDFEVRDTERSDEVGKMAQAVRVFVDKERDRQHLVAEQEKAREEAFARSNALREECASFDKDILSIMDNVKSSVAALSASTGDMTNMADSTLTESTSVTQQADTASTNVETVASAAEELSASVSEIRQQVQVSTDIASKAAEEGNQTNVKVKQLAEAASKIGEVVSLINDIAEQTNLLALNATIEAARAGEAGRGFSVVAAEVKELSTQTTKATEEISGQITAIQNETMEASNAISSVTKTVVEMNEITTSIATSVEQQGLAVEEIARNVLSASEGTRKVSESMASVSTSASTTRNNAEEVQSLADKIEHATDETVGKINTFLDKVKSYG